MRALGFLDETSHALGGDDHELAMRARAHYGWAVGYVPLHVYDERGAMLSNASVLFADGGARDGGGGFTPAEA